MNTIDAKTYRDGMSLLPAAVTVVTTDGEAGKGGMTVSAITSVTDTPATLLICINQNSKMNEMLKTNARFVVNILQASNEEISNRMAGFDGSEPSERFDLGEWKEGTLKQPILKNASAAFECEIVKTDEVGTHSVIYGEVKELHTFEKEESPLMYFNRSYQQFRVDETVTP
ncbi:flavin reductase family protein [Sediminitomix flava]|uniref:4-hydroxyphenylacetate 3-monooxygenase reductase component n=1 Tax=Sediminitomix flava TaxID=379075 RepID=A0A315Z9I0_SEDFL|nr:flavin reductase family protein [Sediminitomix flava]PWJ42161.1 4-hydroxyphenylacetate 3-monooxygenase reductase component [Sediminitomix flava]